MIRRELSGRHKESDKVNVLGWEMTRAESCGEAQAAWDRSQRCHGEVYGSGCPRGYPGWAGGLCYTDIPYEIWAEPEREDPGIRQRGK